MAAPLEKTVVHPGGRQCRPPPEEEVSASPE